MPPERSVVRKISKLIYALVGIMYMTVPSAIDPTPTHHHLSALNGSDGVWITGCLGLKGCCAGSAALLILLFAVAAGAAVVVGFSVCVGSISGGLASKNIGFIGEPSNLYRLSRGTLWKASVRTW